MMVTWAVAAVGVLAFPTCGGRLGVGSVATAYLHPETEPDGLEALQERAADDDVEMRIFKDELRQAIRDPGLLPGNELFRHVAYEDGSDEKFLRRLWRDLYGDEPVIPSDQP